MKKKIHIKIIIALALLFMIPKASVSADFTQENRGIVWNNQIAETNVAYNDMLFTQSGHIIAVGTKYVSTSTSVSAISKYDDRGNLINHYLKPTDSSYNFAELRKVIEYAPNIFIAVGYITTTDNNSIGYIVVFDNNLTILEEKTYESHPVPIYQNTYGKAEFFDIEKGSAGALSTFDYITVSGMIFADNSPTSTYEPGVFKYFVDLNAISPNTILSAQPSVGNLKLVNNGTPVNNSYIKKTIPIDSDTNSSFFSFKVGADDKFVVKRTLNYQTSFAGVVSETNNVASDTHDGRFIDAVSDGNGNFYVLIFRNNVHQIRLLNSNYQDITPQSANGFSNFTPNSTFESIDIFGKDESGNDLLMISGQIEGKNGYYLANQSSNKAHNFTSEPNGNYYFSKSIALSDGAVISAGRGGLNEHSLVKTQVYKTLTFNPNSQSATGTMAPMNVMMHENTTNNIVNIPANTFVNPGFTFIGWSVTPNSYNDDYRTGDSIDVSSSRTLYAIWAVPTLSAEPVTVRYLDEMGNQVINDVTITGNVGDSFTVDRTLIPSTHEFVRADAPETGTLGTTPSTITLTLRVKTTAPVSAAPVTVKYVDADGNPVINDVTITGNVGDPFTVDRTLIPSTHEFVSADAPETGTLGTIPSTITLTLRPRTVAAAPVTVKYLGQNGQPIRDDVVISGVLGTSYKVDRTLVPNGYRIVAIEGSETGVLTQEAQTVILRLVPITDISNSGPVDTLPGTGVKNNTLLLGLLSLNLVLLGSGIIIREKNKRLMFDYRK